MVIATRNTLQHHGILVNLALDPLLVNQIKYTIILIA